MKIFTDGSCLNNKESKKGLSKGGIGVFFGDNHPNNISESLKCEKITNQVAELTAISRALDIIDQLNYKDIIYIFTDSKYVIGIFTQWIKNWEKNNWINSNNKPVLNSQLIQEINNKLKNKVVIFKHVLAHQKKPSITDSNYSLWYGNMMADKLATLASTKN